MAHILNKRIISDNYHVIIMIRLLINRFFVKKQNIFRHTIIVIVRIVHLLSHILFLTKYYDKCVIFWYLSNVHKHFLTTHADVS